MKNEINIDDIFIKDGRIDCLVDVHDIDKELSVYNKQNKLKEFADYVEDNAAKFEETYDSVNGEISSGEILAYTISDEIESEIHGISDNLDDLNLILNIGLKDEYCYNLKFAESDPFGYNALMELQKINKSLVDNISSLKAVIPDYIEDIVVNSF